MHKKIISMAVGLCLISLTMSLPGGSSDHNEHNITFAKLLPDGTIERVEQTIDIVSGDSLSKAIAVRCAALLKEDERFQVETDQGTGIFLIISGGDGLHFALPPALFEIPLLRFSFNIIPSILYCSYSDSEASTDITPLSGDGNVTSFAGPHKILAGGFVGILGWDGVFSFTSAGFAGLTFFTWTSGGSLY